VQNWPMQGTRGQDRATKNRTLSVCARERDSTVCQRTQWRKDFRSAGPDARWFFARFAGRAFAARGSSASRSSMGGESTTSRALVQSAGKGFRLKANLMMQEFNRAGPVLHLLLRYTQALITQMARTAVCNPLAGLAAVPLAAVEPDRLAVKSVRRKRRVQHLHAVRLPAHRHQAEPRARSSEQIRYEISEVAR
jgi:hypothetical protein